jgi:hypothetical protein
MIDFDHGAGRTNRAVEFADRTGTYSIGFQLETGITLAVFPETGRFSKKNREAIEHERAITERD